MGLVGCAAEAVTLITVWERLWAKVRYGFLAAFVIIWTATGAQLFATGQPDSEIFWVFYVAVWAWYAVAVVLPDVRRRRRQSAGSAGSAGSEVR
jgi:hypothetical protein